MELISSLLSLGAGNQDEHSGESNRASGVTVTFTPSVPYFFSLLHILASRHHSTYCITTILTADVIIVLMD